MLDRCCVTDCARQVRVEKEAREVIQSDTLGQHVKRYYRRCKRVGGLFENYAARWSCRQITLNHQWKKIEQECLEKIKQVRLKKRAEAEKSLKFGNAKEIRGVTNSKKEEMIAAMTPFNFDPQTIVSDEVFAHTALTY